MEKRFVNFVALDITNKSIAAIYQFSVNEENLQFSYNNRDEDIKTYIKEIGEVTANGHTIKKDEVYTLLYDFINDPYNYSYCNICCFAEQHEKTIKEILNNIDYSNIDTRSDAITVLRTIEEDFKKLQEEDLKNIET